MSKNMYHTIDDVEKSSLRLQAKSRMNVTQDSLHSNKIHWLEMAAISVQVGPK